MKRSTDKQKKKMEGRGAEEVGIYGHRFVS